MVDVLSIDFSDVARVASRLGAAQDQIPYACALALNQAADNTRNLLIQNTWPSHVHVRNTSFIAASLTTRDARASKRQLAVEIYDKLDRGHLKMQGEGGVRMPHGGSSLAVPVSEIAAARTGRGVPARLKPKNIKAFKLRDGLYVRDKRTKRLRMVYALKASTRIPKRVPFTEDFVRSISRDLIANLPQAIARAMATRR